MIDDEEVWLQMMKDRILILDADDRELMMAIYGRIGIYAPLIRQLFEKYKV